MASSSSSNQFRVTLLRVSRLLTTESVQQLAFLCEHISPTRRRELKGAMDLFDQLQECGVLNEKNVNILISWLDELQLQEASNVLKTYRQKHLENNTQPKGSCTEHGEQLTYFCITCNSQLCSKCFFHSHRYTCEVIELEKLSQEMESRKEKLKKEFDSLQKITETSENLTQKNHTHDRISTGKTVILQKTERLVHELLNGFHGKQLQDTRKREEEEEEIATVGLQIQNVMKPNIDLTCRPELPRANRLRTIVQKVQKELKGKQSTARREASEDWYAELSRDSTLGLPRQGVVGDLYEPLSRNNKFGLHSLDCFVGGVMIRENQLVHVFNERQRRGGVLLVCIDPSNTHTEYWKHLVAVDDNQYPVVMSYKELKYGGINHVLFAVGKTVFILHPRRTGSVYDSVHSVASLLIDDVGEGLWITSIAAHRLHSECDEFLISVRGSSVLREYQISGKALRKVDTKGYIPSINSIGYVQNTFAVCGRHDAVYLTTTDSTMKESGQLQSLSDPSRLLPVCVLWTGGAGWMALFVSKEQEKREWRVSCYNETGQFEKVCVEGTSPRYKGVPVSVTRWGNTGFISFEDSSVNIFEY